VNSGQQYREGGHALLTVHEFEDVFLRGVARPVDADDRAEEVARARYVSLEQIVEQIVPVLPGPGVLTLVLGDLVDDLVIRTEQAEYRLVTYRFDHLNSKLTQVQLRLRSGPSEN
jgi:hypothetical protein